MPDPRADPAAVLTARPPEGPTSPPPAPGLHPLGVDRTRDPLLYVPAGLAAGRPATLVVTLHGAGGDATGGLVPLRSPADAHGLVLLSPASRGPTWDAVLGGYGADTAVLD